MKIKPNATNDFDLQGAKELLVLLSNPSGFTNRELDVLFYVAMGFRVENRPGGIAYRDEKTRGWCRLDSPPTDMSDRIEWLPSDCVVSIDRDVSGESLNWPPLTYGDLWNVELTNRQVDVISHEHKSLPIAMTEAILLFYIAAETNGKTPPPSDCA